MQNTLRHDAVGDREILERPDDVTKASPCFGPITDDLYIITDVKSPAYAKICKLIRVRNGYASVQLIPADGGFGCGPYALSDLRKLTTQEIELFDGFAPIHNPPRAQNHRYYYRR